MGRRSRLEWRQYPSNNATNRGIYASDDTDFLVLIVTQLTLGCGSTTLLMKDGRQLEGMVTSSDANQIQLESADDGSAIFVNRSDVQEVEFSGSSAQFWGIGLTLVGGIASGVGVTIFSNSNDGWGQAVIGGLLFIVGAPLVLTGVPLWIAGSARKNDQRKLYEFDGTSGLFQTPKQPGAYKLTLRF